MVYAILKDGYVINRVIADAMPSDYPFPHDLIVEDVNACIFIGDWYEESENLFYRPIGVPEDWPENLKPPKTEQL